MSRAIEKRIKEIEKEQGSLDIGSEVYYSSLEVEKAALSTELVVSDGERWRIWSALCDYKNTSVLKGDIKTSKQKVYDIIFNEV